MHIPDNYLSPSTCGVLGAVMVPVWVHCIRKVKRELSRERIAFIGIAAAFSFLLMMFNIPLPGGTSGHAVGGTLIALLLGPEAGCLAVTVALAIQALLFGDGGIVAFGANCFNMAFVIPFLGYGIFRLIHDHVKAPWGDTVAAACGAYISINVAALCAAIEFGIQPLLFSDAAGNALYCPYPLAISIPAMLIPHLLVAGVVDAVATVLIYAFIKKVAPEYIYVPVRHATSAPTDIAATTSTDAAPVAKRSLKPVYILIGILCVATPLGLLAGSGSGWLAQFGDAWGEWGTEDIASMVGYTPVGMENGFSWSALLPDYSVAGLPDAVGYILSAVIGVALLVIIFKVVGSLGSGSKHAAHV